jgi:glycosyltransferase involved in cell wall biosynthesis
MRVLHVISTGERRGAEMFASDLIRALNRDGVSQRVAVLRGSPPYAAGYEAESIALASGRVRLRIDRGALRTLRRLIRNERPTIVHAHGNEPFRYALIAGRWTGVPIVYRRIGIASAPGRTGWRRFLHGRLMQRSDRIVAVADAVRRETIDTFRVPGRRVTTLPRAVDPSRLVAAKGRAATRGELRIPQDARVVISLGALSDEKDPLAHVRVFDEVRSSVPNAFHVIAGDGPLRAQVEREVEERGLGPVVRVLGTRSDVGDLLSASDVMILASKVEGMPGCLVEAGMVGIPAVATDVAGVREVIEDGVTGYVVPAGAHAELARRTIELLTDDPLRDRFGRAAEERCRATYSIEAIAPRYVDVYRDAARGEP